MPALFEITFATSHPRWPKRQALVVKREGLGEIAPLEGVSSESFEEAKEETLRIWPDLEKASLPSVRFAAFTSCRADLCKRRPTPFCPLETPLEGVRELKIKLGGLSVEEALEKAWRFEGYHLRLDVNCGWSLAEALAFMEGARGLNIAYLEEPLKEIKDLETFSRKGFPIAIDESFGKVDLKRLPSLKAVVIKPTVVGGVPKIGIPVVLSSSYESSLGHLLIANLWQQEDFLPGLGTIFSVQDDLLERKQIEAGCLHFGEYHEPIQKLR